jgi:sugar phosphate isomerase/epimerase
MRKMNFEEMTDFAAKMGFTDLQMWSSTSGGHIDPLAPWDEIKRQKETLDRKGLKAYAFGVTRATRNEEELRKVFEFARYMGMEMIITEPKEKRQLDLLEKFALVYDIKVAVHNHTIESPFGNPLTVKMLLADRDPRIGVCLDAGWMTTTGLDVAEVYRGYGDRVFDIHLKDKLVHSRGADHDYTDVDIGTGDANLIGLFKAMKETGYSGRIAIETDQQLEDPTDFVKGAVAFVKQHGVW